MVEINKFQNLNSFIVSNNKTEKKEIIEKKNTLVSITSSTLDINPKDILEKQEKLKKHAPIISFVDKNSEDISNPIKNFEQIINNTLKEKKVKPDLAKKINEKQIELKNLILTKINSIEDVNKLSNTLLYLVQQLNSMGCFTPQVQEDLNKLTQLILDRTGHNFNLQLKLVTINGEILGVKCKTNNGSNLTKEQEICLDILQEMCSKIEKIKSFKNQLTPEFILLLGIREELLRRSFERLIPKPEEKVPEELIYTDLGIISNALNMIDSMLSGTREIPPNLITDLQKTVDEMMKAPIGKIADVLKNLGDKTKTPDTKGIQIKEITQKIKNDSLKSPSLNSKVLQDQINQLNNKIQHLQDGDDLSVNKEIQNLINGIKDQINSIKSPSAKPIMDLVNNLQNLIQTQNINAPSNDLIDVLPISDLNKVLIKILNGAPYDLNKNVGEVIDAYTKVMNVVDKNLPPLYFPITLPTPMVYDDGSGNKFILPAGSKLSQDRKTKAYTIQSPGILMQSGNTLITSGKSTINLGNGKDQLLFDRLNVATDESNTLLNGFKGEIDRKNNTAIIHADEVRINNDGTVDITNANMVYKPGLFEINSDSFFSQNGEDHTAFSGFKLSQTTGSDGSSTISGSANNIDIKKATTVITADNLSFNMTQNNGSGFGQFDCTNLNMVSGDNTLKATSSSIGIVTNPDGSSSMVLKTKDVHWVTPTSKLDTIGNSDITVNYDTNGNLSAMKAKSENIKYTDNKGGIVDVNNGTFGINYKDGKIKDLSVNAAQFNYQNKDTQVSAENANFNMVYGDNGLLRSINGNANNFKYNGENGKLDVAKGDVSVTFGENGKLSSFNGTSNNVHWDGTNGDKLNANNTSLSMNCYEDGTLSQVTTTMGHLNFTSKQGDKLNVINGAVDIKYNPNGTLSNATGSADLLKWEGKSGDILKANNTTLNVSTNSNGTFKNINTTIGNLNVLTKDGNKVDVINGSADINFNDNGTLKDVTASTESLKYVGTNGDTFSGSGINIGLNCFEDGTLQSIHASSGELDYQGKIGKITTNGQTFIDINYSDGNLDSLAGHTDELNFTGDSGVLGVKDGDINVNFNSNGTLSGVNATIQNFNWQGKNRRYYKC